MDIFNILGYLNKFSLTAFFITFLVLGYQIYSLKKESNLNKNNPIIPDFKEDLKVPSLNYTEIKPEKLTVNKKINNKLIILLLITVGVMVLIFKTVIFKNSKVNQETVADSVIKFISSSGIKIYTLDWAELKISEIKKFKGGENIIITIETVPDENVDNARFKINQKNWDEKQKVLYNKERKVFFLYHIIATGESFLKIEAQLHSKTDGWLGD
ncbi:MAG: hypothetical protein UR89_C0019G0012 [Candidatus Roizmanbacteria bacterium GW2011_GWA2_35_8]|uniref:Uncharacterized protein n=1 Tax=Candidatus Roizmanbacteria bacterium GW2011_GWA2_35_8 TaxID=1618479 RepID=A0A0G0CZX5_9BACT|nr:MAG: hypothetical protein UR89_C0019G0012 [Candidatus Roizmanbacteria bacterium GW2011_GWA2_35_8]